MIDRNIGEMKDIVSNDLFLDSGVWRTTDKREINYSDGIEHEKYIEQVLKRSKDLSSSSDELTSEIRDWTSEYHLSKKRSQLLSGFKFDKSDRVLEIGCGCGAITRFLGEEFDNVVSVEGALARARLARLRTNDMSHVNIVNAPFQDINFTIKFDVIVCIGVFEYSSSFISGDDPHEEALSYFRNLLSEDGVVLIAIENQFGLKYFSSSKEDHTNVMFDGVEGYPRFENSARTFGYVELRQRLSKYFKEVEFYFPYPDYKLPSCVLSEKAFKEINPGELIGGYQFGRNNDYFTRPLFDEQLALLELEKNKKLAFFANSFLVVAGNRKKSSIDFPQLGIFFESDRKQPWQTVSRIERNDSGEVWVSKTPVGGEKKITLFNMSLQETSSPWIDNVSLETTLLKKCRFKDITLDSIFSPCVIWLDSLKNLSKRKNGEFFLDGGHLDCIWRNSYISGDKSIFIDNEWIREGEVPLNVIVIRAIFYFLVRTESINDVSPLLQKKSTKKTIRKIAKVLKVTLTERDFGRFISLESDFSRKVHGKRWSNSRVFFQLYLYNKGIIEVMLRLNRGLSWSRNLAKRARHYIIRFL